MKRGYSKAMLASALAATLALSPAPAHAQSRAPWTRASHPEQILAQSAEARRVWHAAVPAELRREAWVYDLHGTAGPIQVVATGSGRYLTGNICKPHDCGPHSAAWLIALDHSRAAGAIDLNPDRSHGPRHYRFFGEPTAAERDQLLVSLYGGR